MVAGVTNIGGHMNKRVWKVNTKAIADATGQPARTVRRHINEGKLDPSDLIALSKYVFMRAFMV